MPSGKNKHRVKGKAISLSSFLTGDDTPSGFAAVVTGYNWGDVMEDIPVDDTFTLDKNEFTKDSKILYLPTAPKAVRGPDVDMNKVPTEPPFTAYLGNLPFDVIEEDIHKFFHQLKVVSVKFPRDAERGRMKGFGYAEFVDKQSLLEALILDGASLNRRTIQVKLAGDEETEKDHDRRNGRSDRTTGNWRATGRDETFSRDSNDDRQRTGTWFNRNDRSDRGGNGGRRENDSRDDSDWSREDVNGFKRDDRGYDRRNRGGYERRDYGNRERNATKERRKLQLKPRSVPIEQQDSNSFSSASIFGGAKPVDTTKKERVIEERLLQGKEILQQEIGKYSKGDQHCSSSSTFAKIVENAKGHDSGVTCTEENDKNTEAFKSTGFDSKKPRSVSVEQQDSSSFRSASIFGGAKPVDTTKKEREIEKRLLQEKEILRQSLETYSKDDQHCSSSSAFAERVENVKEHCSGVKHTEENDNMGDSKSTGFGSEKSVDTETTERQTGKPLAREREQESGKQFRNLARHSSGARSPSSSERHDRRSSSRQEDDAGPWTEYRRRNPYNQNYGSNNREKYYDRRNNYSRRYGKDDDDAERGRRRQYFQSSGRNDGRDARRQLEQSQENDYDRRNNYSHRYGNDDDAERDRHRQYSQSNGRNDRRDARRQLEQSQEKDYDRRNNYSHRYGNDDDDDAERGRHRQYSQSNGRNDRRDAGRQLEQSQEKDYDRRNNYSHQYRNNDDDDAERGRHRQYSGTSERNDRRDTGRQLEQSQENDYDQRNNYSHRYGKDDDVADRGRRRQYSQYNEHNDRRDERRQLERNVRNAQKCTVPQSQDDKPPVYTNKFQHLMSDGDGNGSE